jgi:hypothetical protein
LVAERRLGERAYLTIDGMSITRRAKGSSLTIVTGNEADCTWMRMSQRRRTIRPRITPVEFSVNEKKEVALCQCKQTKTQPFCDGTQQTL